MGSHTYVDQPHMCKGLLCVHMFICLTAVAHSQNSQPCPTVKEHWPVSQPISGCSSCQQILASLVAKWLIRGRMGLGMLFFMVLLLDVRSWPSCPARHRDPVHEAGFITEKNAAHVHTVLVYSGPKIVLLSAMDMYVSCCVAAGLLCFAMGSSSAGPQRSNKPYPSFHLPSLLMPDNTRNHR